MAEWVNLLTKDYKEEEEEYFALVIIIFVINKFPSTLEIETLIFK